MAYEKDFNYAFLKATKRKREDGQCFSIDNLLDRGVLRYLSNSPLKGFEPVDDYLGWLESSLKAIHPPRYDDASNRNSSYTFGSNLPTAS